MHRRKFLLACGSVSTVTIAGCSGDDGDENGAENGDGNNTDNGGENGTDNGGENGTDNGEDGSGDPDEELGEFEGTAQGGYVGFGRNNAEEAREDGTTIPSPEETDNPLILDGILYGDLRWEALDFEVPRLNTGITTVDADAPDGFEGTFEFEEDLMTAEGTIIIEARNGATLEFEVNPTTKESGDLTGSMEVTGGGLVVTMVDNEFIVDDSLENERADEEFGLPATDPGENYLEITFLIEPDEELVEELFE